MTARRERFISEYLVDQNGAAAARRAGYAARSARQTAAELLAKPDIAVAIQRKREQVAQRLAVTHDTIAAGFIEAFETARETSDARAMIAACHRLAEFCGLYAESSSATTAASS
ncbi:terminase small subunit [Thiorhodovibrio winogradskyi]|uniref:terminase small subunit n=1 Tax=Thiorhodovibrio winogradskyi TaxID=77007 RepID=UPI0038B601E3